MIKREKDTMKKDVRTLRSNVLIDHKKVIGYFGFQVSDFRFKLKLKGFDTSA